MKNAGYLTWPQFKTVASILITYLGSYLLPGSIGKEIAISEGLNIATIVLMFICCFYCAQVSRHLSGICFVSVPSHVCTKVLIQAVPEFCSFDIASNQVWEQSRKKESQDIIGAEYLWKESVEKYKEISSAWLLLWQSHLNNISWMIVIVRFEADSELDIKLDEVSRKLPVNLSEDIYWNFCSKEFWTFDKIISSATILAFFWKKSYVLKFTLGFIVPCMWKTQVSRWNIFPVSQWKYY